MRPALLLLILLTWLLASRHKPVLAQSDGVCWDELLVRWNEFGADANKHIQTVEASHEKREKTHAKLDREWQALKALACW